MLKLSTTCFGTKVAITRSGERGTVTGFCQHMRGKTKMFYVEYTDAVGVSREGWFYVDQLTIID